MKMYVPIHDSSSNIDQEYTKKHEVQVDVVEQLHISIESLIEIIKREYLVLITQIMILRKLLMYI